MGGWYAIVQHRRGFSESPIRLSEAIAQLQPGHEACASEGF
jgi:hypothetical protein